MSVCYECCVLSCRGLCDELNTRPEESYRLWCVVVCVCVCVCVWSRNLVKEEALAQWGLLRHEQTNKKLENFIIYDFVAYPEFCLGIFLRGKVV